MDWSDRQKEIVAASLELIAENGIQGLTTKNLARKIGFSEAAIYRHYENKIQILLAILEYFKENSQKLFLSQTQSDEDAILKIERLYLKQFQVFAASPSLVAVIFSEELFRNENVLHEKVAEILNQNIAKLTQIINAGQEKQEIRNDIEAAHLALVVMGSMRLFVKQWHMANYSFPLEERGREFTTSIKMLLGK